LFSPTLTIEEGTSVGALLDFHRKAIETVELAERVTALEEGIKNDKSPATKNGDPTED
jgi:hypothetical protein